MSPEQIAQDVFDKLERERGVFHYNDKEELIRRFAQALLDAETRGLANGTLCTVPAKDLPCRGSCEPNGQLSLPRPLPATLKAEELRATRDVEAAFPGEGTLAAESVARYGTPFGSSKLSDHWRTKAEGFRDGVDWLKSELLSRLGGNKK